MKTINHWIDGKECSEEPQRRAPVWNPATGAQQAWVALASAADVDRAVQTAAKAFESWSQVSLSRRTKVLFAFRELVRANARRIAEAITDEQGKVLSDAEGEVQRGLEVVEFACGIPTLLKGEYSDQVSSGVDLFSFREPLGVVAGITPFNFPAMVPMWMFPVAIACGNTFVLKPSERDPSASMLLAELWAQAGLPEGVFNVVRSMPCSSIPKCERFRLLVPHRLPGISMKKAAPPESACRRWGVRRITPSSCRTRRAHMPWNSSLRRRLGRPASAAWLSRRRWR
jgi:malonate-semialdehyde dehydrogenase (acetylating)/methylmalonate-semialdehyde dehydrogenase